MEIRRRKVETEIVEYIASDGHVCLSEEACKSYERSLENKKAVDEAEKLRIPELDGVMPLDFEGITSEYGIYRWYRVHNYKEFCILNKACCGALRGVGDYPEVICIEFSSDGKYEGYIYDYVLSNIMVHNADFWKKMGYNVSLTPLESKINI